MSSTASTPPQIARRHDLDALRAIAMLLGIVLHAALSFFPSLWPVQDSQQSGFFAVLVNMLHGFRMPIFFMMSGFFTAMLWRKRGLKSLLWHRFVRIFVPFVLFVVTIIPLTNVVIGMAMSQGWADRPIDTTAMKHARSGDLWQAIRAGDHEALQEELEAGADLARLHPETGMTPVNLAVLLGDGEAVAMMLDAGADINARNRDGSTPLHSAAFLGRPKVAELLLARGAATNLTNNYGQTPAQVLNVDWGTTQFIAQLVEIEVDQETVMNGRRAIAEMLSTTIDPSGGEGDIAQPSAGQGGLEALYFILFQMPVFHHLWFLYFLCWLLVGFTFYALIANAVGWRGLPQWLMLSPWCYVWVIALTMVPQWFMYEPAFGPDTSAGLLPMPHVLLYYAIFFGVGALYFDTDDPSGRLGRGYWVTLPVALLVLYPLWYAITHRHLPLGWLDLGMVELLLDFLQAGYAWLMTFGLLGLFRDWLSTERPVMRYISDSSYWLYIVHLPLVIVLQMWVADWPLPAWLKFALIVLAAAAVLLLTYRYLVRYTVIGWLLNGRRKPPAKSPV